MPTGLARRRILAVAGVVLGGLSQATAQIQSNASCLSTYEAFYNSKGQIPCLVASYLGGACNGGEYTVAALNPGEHYIGPTTLTENSCQCNTVMYSAMAACSVCQNATYITWSSWSSACQSVYISIFPEPIPADTAIPGWAYENVTTEGQFDINQALADHSPESTATGLPKTATAPGGSSPSSSATPSSSSGKKSDTGAIAGGVVGGVVGVAILAGLGFFLIRKYAGKPKSGNNGFVDGYAASEKTGQAGSSTLHPTSDMYNTSYMGESMPTTYSPASPPPKLYDPNDPSTFPTASSPPPQGGYGGVPYAVPSGGPHSYSPVVNPVIPNPQTTYHGAPEV